MNIYFFGYGGSSYLAEELRSLINQLDCELFTIHEWDSANIKWDRLTVLNHLRKADVIILPCDYERQPAKSNNRLTQSMSLGKPCIVSPLPAYLKIIEKYPGCALVARSKEEWKQHVEFLKNPEERLRISSIALEASKEFSLGEITKKWVSVFSDLDKTDIVIPTYNNLVCLRQCLDSIRACTKSLYNVIVVDNGSNDDVKTYLEAQGDIVYIRKGRMNFAQAVNTGLRVCASKYVCILNDDVIVSNGWLESMIEVCKNDVGAVGTLSNCDQGWQHNNSINIKGIELHPGIHRPGEISNIIEDIYTYRSPYNDVIERSWVAFYCTLIPKVVLDRVGLLDELSFSNSGEDVDYNYRISRLGYRIIQTYKAFVFHYGAVARHIVESEDPEKYHLLDKNNMVVLNEKWNKKTVCIYSGASWEKWSFKSLDTGIGGSEIWLINLSRQFERLGYRVIVFADCQELEMRDNSILWMHYSKFSEFVEYNWIDYFISSRTEDPFQYNIRSKKNFIISHDVWLLSGQQIKYADKVTKYLCLSEWHRDFFSDHHKIPKDKIAISANGIDFSRFESKEEKNPYRLHWSSSWDRGLDNVLYLWPFIKDKIPLAELHVFYGVYNWKESCKLKNDQEGLKKIEELEQKTRQDGVFTHGRVDQVVLAKELLKSSLFLYPGWFSETFCITAVEAQRAGVPVIANKYAGLKTTLGDSAILLGDGTAYWPYTKEGREAFLKETVSILTDSKRWDEWSEKGFQNSEKYSWEKVALMWKGLFEEGDLK